jgi:hypothetical protein
VQRNFGERKPGSTRKNASAACAVRRPAATTPSSLSSISLAAFSVRRSAGSTATVDEPRHERYVVLEQAVLREWRFFSFLGKPGLLLRNELISPVPGMRVLDMPCDPCALEFGRCGPFLSGTL